MDSKTYDAFLNSLHRIVNEKGAYQEKLEALKEKMSDRDANNMQELISWFPEE
jgi:hypothetical protein